jgi:hypothetical protein
MSATPALTCRHCKQPITALQQRQAGICSTAACRHRAAQARLQRLAQTVGQNALLAAAPHLREEAATVLWLQDFDTRLIAVTAPRRDAHRAHLESLIAEPSDADIQPLAPAAAASTLGAQDGRLCAQCGGRCCSHGGQRHAFITLPQLLRWQQAEPGRTLQDAVIFFMERLPPEHVAASCLYHGARGCALPREHRADVCNAHTCDALDRVQATLRDAPRAAFVAITLSGDSAVRSALVQPDATHHLP